MAHRNKLPERYPDMIALYARGHASSLEVLKTDFGHWPPNDVNIVHAPDIDIQFKSVFSTGYGLKRLVPSWVNLAIGANLLKSNLLNGIAFFALTTALKGLELGGFVNIADKPKTIHVNDAYRAFGFFRGGRRFLSHIISHEFKHVVQARDHRESLSSSLDDNRLNIEKFLKEGAKAHIKYLAEECELQARLHTVIVGAYHQFEKLPLTRKELYAVLQTQGLKMPESILAQLRETGRGALAKQKFIKDEELFNRYADKSAIKDLNRVFANLSAGSMTKFWDDVIPFIYGDLLELYGDQQGHKRMGHTHNIQLREIFYRCADDYQTEARALRRRQVVTQSDLAKAKNHFAKAIEIVQKMDRADTVDLGCKIVRGDIYQEHGKAVRVSASRSELGRTTLEAIWSRRDLTNADRATLQDAKNQPAQDDRKSRIFIRPVRDSRSFLMTG